MNAIVDEVLQQLPVLVLHKLPVVIERRNYRYNYALWLEHKYNSPFCYVNYLFAVKIIIHGKIKAVCEKVAVIIELRP